MSREAVTRQLDELGAEYDVFECDPDLADTAEFCDAYGFDPSDSANTIIVVGKSNPRVYVACVLLATTRLDVNGTVRRRLGIRRTSFASAEESGDVTGMAMGGVTAFGLPDDLPIWIDSAVMTRKRIVLGGGSRDCKILAKPEILELLPNAETVEGLANEWSN
jgi:prolyl-tRNA editing enzyme YbaK/EbsC (Cys-tRNA(Pro) deacylase)